MLILYKKTMLDVHARDYVEHISVRMAKTIVPTKIVQGINIMRATFDFYTFLPTINNF